jgi:hypothetical protein
LSSATDGWNEHKQLRASKVVARVRWQADGEKKRLISFSMAASKNPSLNSCASDGGPRAIVMLPRPKNQVQQRRPP